MSLSQYVIINEVEDFLRRWKIGELVLTPASLTMVVIVEEGKNFFGRPKQHKVNFPNEIGTAISNYQLQKDVGNYRSILQSAYELLTLVQRARTFGVLKDTKLQIKDYEEEIQQLKQRIDYLMKLNEKLLDENKKLHNLLPNAKGRTEVGDVTSNK